MGSSVQISAVPNQKTVTYKNSNSRDDIVIVNLGSILLTRHNGISESLNITWELNFVIVYWECLGCETRVDK